MCHKNGSIKSGQCTYESNSQYQQFAPCTVIRGAGVYFWNALRFDATKIFEFWKSIYFGNLNIYPNIQLLFAKPFWLTFEELLVSNVNKLA